MANGRLKNKSVPKKAQIEGQGKNRVGRPALAAEVKKEKKRN